MDKTIWYKIANLDILLGIKPPLGVEPYHLWCEGNPDPTLDECIERFEMVFKAVKIYRECKIEPKQEWLYELGLI